MSRIIRNTLLTLTGALMMNASVGEKPLIIYFDNSFYDITPIEYNEFYNKSATFNGKPLVMLADSAGNIQLLENYVPGITRKGERSIKRLADRLTQGVKHEDMAQKLLDFVTTQINYDLSDTNERKIPEILTTATAKCSGKTRLLSSLYIQKGIEHLLAYFPTHLCVAVQGNYEDAINSSFMWKGKRYIFAETTYPSYKIGKTVLQDPLYFKDVMQLQKPGDNSELIDLNQRKDLTRTLETIAEDKTAQK